MDVLKTVTAEFNLKEEHAQNIVTLLDEGNTIPFIARYRKELTGHIDDQVLREFADRLTYLRNLEQRKEEVSRIIAEQGKLTDEITEALANAVTLTEVEDIYRPYKQKKKTRATVAMAKGLTPLAELIIAQEIKEGKPEDYAREYINEELGVKNEKEALAGACDIIAEWVSDNAELRKKLRNIYMRNGEISSKLLKSEEEESKVYEMYDDYQEPVGEIKSHRVLALNRGEKEGFLRVKVAIDKDFGGRVCMASYVKQGSIFTPLVEAAAQDGYERLIAPSIEREIRSSLTESANEQAIKMFEVNLRPLLMQPPMRDKVTLGWDPAFRTGCKLAVVDETGKVLDKTVIYPTQPQNKVEEGKAVVRKLIAKYGVEVISIGNGTASKESEIIVADLVKEYNGKVTYMVVSEAGASVYSASKLGAEEFPDYDVSERSAVSIARRLQDPLAELIKIDPKSIGVGQYQHDMPENRLDSVLKGVMEDCVNKVGADLNTASVQLLSYIAGINSGIAKNIVAYREEHGKFKTRKELLKVSKLGEKAFTQCAGFLRVPGAKNILDNTGVHPESYDGTQKLLQLFGYSDADVRDGKLGDLNDKIKSFGVKKVCEFTGLGEITLNDITAELLKPGRDVRDALPKPMLRTDVMDIADLVPGMKIKGTVRNVIDFGAFIDIGVHQDGLVHISEISDRFIRHPSEVLKVGDVVEATVISVDVRKKRIGLSLKQKPIIKK
ncbi:MAG: RNA-binding transcriptional accessory protein [Clostridiales bacterium]|nr:RNA-binding transcriptional accessory protein [Clostridiales bacterium]